MCVRACKVNKLFTFQEPTQSRPVQNFIQRARTRQKPSQNVLNEAKETEDFLLFIVCGRQAICTGKCSSCKKYFSSFAGKYYERYSFYVVSILRNRGGLIKFY